MKISTFGKKMTVRSGICQLMDDLGSALSGERDILMLGGGSPAHIPAMEERFRMSMMELLKNGDKFERAIGDYDPPQGNREFIDALATLLRKEFGWQIGLKNVAITHGSQSAFIMLFNIFAGIFDEDKKRKILLPISPEYIGYCDVGFVEDIFTAVRPRIEHIDDHIFKYHIDFDKLNITDEIGAICVSRPTNPTGNVLTDSEIKKLSKLARKNDVPLIIDNAYGMPFPNIVFTDATPYWDENVIMCMTLSKLGLPGTRTGIVIAKEEVIDMVAKMNAIMFLAPGSMGAAVATKLVRSGEILSLSRNIIQPFYREKADQALSILLKELDGVDFHIHKPEGALFLWLWFRDLPITSLELYERLKKRGVIVVPGNYFFPGLDGPWQHKNECIRINHSRDEETITKGLKIIADEVKQIYAGK